MNEWDRMGWMELEKKTMENLKYAENTPPGWRKSILMHFKNKTEALT